MKAAQSLRAPPGPSNAKSSNPLEEHSKIIIAFAKRFTIYHGLWIHKDSMGIPCPVLDLDEEADDKYKSPEARIRYMAYMLYTELPPVEGLHECMEKMPGFAKMVRRFSN